jgi:cytochrome c oxidase assembly protein subunit 15
MGAHTMTSNPARLALFRRVAFIATCLAFLVVVLGAWVRLSAAGLGCPDWPGCYGHLTAEQAAQNVDAVNHAFPGRPFEYHKAVKEMVHRYFATSLGFLTLILAAIAIANRRDPQQPVLVPVTLVGLVIFQGLLGMWTVTLLLKPLVVVLHLLGGLATLSVLAWLAMRKDSQPHTRPAARTPLRKLALAALALLVLQIALGGWTSSNYAALACPDFPTCQEVLWPEMDVEDAFVLWRGLGIDYEGGVLDHPARVAIHFVHRLGAIVAALTIAILSFAVWRQAQTPTLKFASVAVGIILVVQLVLGPLMVVHGLPLTLATAHNGVAALLLLSIVRLNRLLRPH